MTGALIGLLVAALGVFVGFLAGRASKEADNNDLAEANLALLLELSKADKKLLETIEG